MIGAAPDGGAPRAATRDAAVDIDAAQAGMDAGAVRDAGDANADATGELAQDAAAGGDAALERHLVLTLTVLGRTPVTRLVAPCSGGCIDVTPEITGGRPPYQLSWDGGVANTGRVCASAVDAVGAAFDQEESLYVTSSDSLGAVETNGVRAERPSTCQSDAGMSADARWTVCHVPSWSNTPCAGGGVYALSAEVPAKSSLELEFEIGGLTIAPASLRVEVSQQPCGETQALATAQAWPLRERELTLTATTAAAGRFLRVTPEDPGLTVRLFRVCERLTP